MTYPPCHAWLAIIKRVTLSIFFFFQPQSIPGFLCNDYGSYYCNGTIPNVCVCVGGCTLITCVCVCGGGGGGRALCMCVYMLGCIYLIYVC